MDLSFSVTPYLLFFDLGPASVKNRTLHQRQAQVYDILQHRCTAPEVAQLKGRPHQLQGVVHGEAEGLVTAGGTHIGDGGNLELTYGKFLTDKWLLRGGLFDGDVGIGVDYGYGSPFMISLAAMDPNDQRYRIRGEFELFDDTYAVAQFVRPYSAENGGNYFGIKRVF